MKQEHIEIYSDLIDNAVVRMPERNTLGSVMQGDTLFLMHADLMDILESHKHEPDSELFYRIYLLAQNIEERLTHYILVCKQHNIKLSFDIEFSVQDYQELL